MGTPTYNDLLQYRKTTSHGRENLSVNAEGQGGGVLILVFVVNVLTNLASVDPFRDEPLEPNQAGISA